MERRKLEDMKAREFLKDKVVRASLHGVRSLAVTSACVSSDRRKSSRPKWRERGQRRRGKSLGSGHSRRELKTSKLKE